MKSVRLPCWGRHQTSEISHLDAINNFLFDVTVLFRQWLASTKGSFPTNFTLSAVVMHWFLDFVKNYYDIMVFADVSLSSVTSAWEPGNP